jgi:hypothetical protein
VIEWDDGLHAKLTAEATAAKLEQGRASRRRCSEHRRCRQRIASAVTTPEATYHWRMQTPERLFMALLQRRPRVCSSEDQRTLPESRGSSVRDPFRTFSVRKTAQLVYRMATMQSRLPKSDVGVS